MYDKAQMSQGSAKACLADRPNSLIENLINQIHNSTNRISHIHDRISQIRDRAFGDQPSALNGAAGVEVKTGSINQAFAALEELGTMIDRLENMYDQISGIV